MPYLTQQVIKCMVINVWHDYMYKTSIALHPVLSCTAVPSIASPEEQGGGGSGAISSGVIAGITVGVLLVVIAATVAGIVCAVKSRTHTKSKNIRTITNEGFGMGLMI